MLLHRVIRMKSRPLPRREHCASERERSGGMVIRLRKGYRGGTGRLRGERRGSSGRGLE